MTKKLLLALSIISSLLCFHANAQNSNTVHIEVTRNSVEDSWHVKYNFSEPVYEASFYQLTNKFRNTLFQIKTPGVTIKSNDNYESIVVDNPKGITELILTHKTYDAQVHQSYEFHSRFSQTDIVAYSGYYYLENLKKASGWDRPLLQTFNFRINGRGYVMANGKRGKDSISWESTTTQPATFVYFGDTEPIAQNGFQLLIDPQLPEWVRETYAELFPKMVNFYSNALYHLPEEAWGVIAYDGRSSGFSRSGGAINGSNTVFISALGEDWNNENPSSGITRPKQKFIAHHTMFHEFVHMWNANNPAIKLTQSWLWEGSAEAFAYETYEKLGLKNSTLDLEYAKHVEYMYKYDLNKNYIKCISSLKSALAKKSNRLDDYDFGYGCGHMIGILTDRAPKLKNNSQDIFSFWKELFETSFKNHRSIDAQNYLELLDKTTDNQVVKNTINTLINGALDEEMASGRFLDSALTSLGETFHISSTDTKN
jgi:hypothetical protein